MRRIALLALGLALAGCGGDAPEANDVVVETNYAAITIPERQSPIFSSPAADWIGHWRGPEGLTLDIARDEKTGDGIYSLKMKYTLDDEGSFKAVATPTGLSFERNGKPLTVTAGSGAKTGMKWLAGKKDCLVVIYGSEGYCRD
ncbi:hypothetical protein [Sphingomonas sp. ID0503]|uniref:hypothetical protein n=1 Tax=Sphingomonas sp. ID0503 TaxID=3399691 RepID=UPI003AFB3FA8